MSSMPGRVLLLTVLMLSGACYEPTKPAERIWENAVTSLDGLHALTEGVMQLDTETSFDRNGSLRVETLGDSEFFLYAIEGDALAGVNLENAQISYQARIRTEGLDGEAPIQLGVRIAGGDTYQAVPDMPPLEGSTDWVMQEANFFTGRGEKPDGIFVMLAVKGAGLVWVDHLKVLSTPRRAR